MANDYEAGIKKQISKRVASLYSENIDIEEVDIFSDIKDMLCDFGLSIDDNLSLFLKEEVSKYGKKDSSFLTESVSIPVLSKRWLLKESVDKNKTYWYTYAQNIKKHLGFSDEAVSKLEVEALDIVNRLTMPHVPYDPQNKDWFIRKGLVYGHVQSGKTASMGAVISQYASFGGNVIIVLSGIHNNLWNQTQERLRRDLDIDNNSGNKSLYWDLITATGDGISPNAISLKTSLVGSNNKKVVIGVFKKNSVVLERLLTNYLKVDQYEDRSYLEHANVLIIDDECDQAGVDVSKNDAEERSKINAAIVKLFNFFPKFSYIGYTATPFANVLNEKPGRESMYPSDFITMLSEKEDYYGASKIFGLGEEFETYSEYNDPSLEAVQIFKQKNKNGIGDDTLREALVYFVEATAVKRLRARYLNDNSMYQQHSTMMIHTSFKTNDHSTIAKQVEAILKTIRSIMYSEEFKKELQNIWQKVFVAHQKHNIDAIRSLFSTPVQNLYIPNFEEVVKEALYVLPRIEIIIENSKASEDSRLSYDKDKTDFFVVIGGNTLSRGLTLEGLLVSVFARNVKTYDTLMQMGRWFGYRKNYEDLVRLWMTVETEEKMKFLAGIELDIKDTIERYQDFSPLQLAMAIRTTPHMQIVRKLAMKAAEKATINYVGRHPQTICFKNDKKWLEDNIHAVKTLLGFSSQNYKRLCNDGFLYESVSPKLITNFINEYLFYENTNGLDSKLLTSFKDKAEKEGYIDSWNVVVKTRLSNSGAKDDTLVEGQTVNLLIRGKLDEGDAGNRLYLKAITSPGDVVCDIPNGPTAVNGMTSSNMFKYRNDYYSRKNKKVPGLIVIYPIYKNSVPTQKNTVRKPLNAKADVYGVSFFFPSLAKFDSKLYDSVSIKLDDEYIKNVEEFYDEKD